MPNNPVYHQDNIPAFNLTPDLWYTDFFRSLEILKLLGLIWFDIDCSKSEIFIFINPVIEPDDRLNLLALTASLDNQFLRYLTNRLAKPDWISLTGFGGNVHLILENEKKKVS